MSERYDTLLQAWRKERHTSDIQPLPDSFLANMTNYVSELREGARMLDKGSLRGKIVEKEKENAERMLGELTQLRLRKLIVAELDGAPISGSDLTREEKALHSELRSLLSGHDERVKSILRGRVPKVEAKPQPEPGLIVVRFLQAVPAIMGIDMKTYGPFEPEDVASIPAENAENLIRRGIAKGVEIRE
jgi:DNA replication initiation complex subunit (GINS family)